MQNPFSWDYLTAPLSRTPIWGPFSIAFVVVFGLGFLMAFFMYNNADHRLKENRILLKAVKRGTSIALGVFGLGLFFFVFRLMHVNAFGLYMRIWLYLCALAAVAMVAYFVYYIRVVYPNQLQELQARRVKQRYLAPAVTGGSGGHRKRSRGKKSNKKSGKKKR